MIIQFITNKFYGSENNFTATVNWPCIEIFDVEKVFLNLEKKWLLVFKGIS